MTPILVAGDSVDFQVSLSNYPASAGWVLKYRLVPRTATNAAIEMTSASAGDEHRVQIAASATATWAPDAYGWTAWTEKGEEKYTVTSGQTVVRPDPRAAAPGLDTRSLARKALDDARAAFAAWTPTSRSYRIGDRERVFNSTAEILRVISYWQMEVNREAAAGDTTQAALNGGRFYLRATR